MKTSTISIGLKKLKRYVCVFLTTLLLCIAVLYAAAYLPQKSIDRNVKKSAEIMVKEGLYPTYFDYSYGTRLDNWTDAIMLMESKAMSKDYLDAVWTNPRFTFHGSEPVDALHRYVNMDSSEYDQYDKAGVFYFYSRYWMGFRATLRLLLSFFDYYQLKRYLAFTFFALFAALISSISRRTKGMIGFLFAVSILLVRPYIICASLQFSCCFLIAFLGMLLVPWVDRKPEREGLFFMEIGMLTMFFDFYTTPILTFGLPMGYLMVLRAMRRENLSLRNLFQNFAIWLTSYGLMWISKLALTSLLTPIKEIERGLSSFLSWIGVGGYHNKGGIYDLSETFIRLWKVLTAADKQGRWMTCASLAILMILLIGAVLCKKVDWQRSGQNLALLILALFPIAWFVITSEPVRVHFWFQYRTVALTYWALGAYGYFAFKHKDLETFGNISGIR